MREPMTHTMRLQSSPFEMIASGQKTIELRLFDEKRQTIAVGDQIRFINATDETQVLLCKVLALHRFDSFSALYASLPLQKCGYTEEEISVARPEDMELYYSKEEQSRYGVVGIEIALIG